MIDPHLFMVAAAARRAQEELMRRGCWPIVVIVGPSGEMETQTQYPAIYRDYERITDAWAQVCAALAATDAARLDAAQQRMREVWREVETAHFPAFGVR